MDNTKQRSELLLGKDAIDNLAKKTVLVVGVGGVGGFCVEALARVGIGHLILIDKDTVEITNVNRQLIATTQTVGQVKVDLFKERIHTIDPHCKVDVHHAFYDESMNDVLDTYMIDFVIDCIDSMKSKQELISYCLSRNIPFLCSMGMARRNDPSQLAVMELEKTSYDPMAKKLRVWKRKNRIRKKIMVVASLEPPVEMKDKDFLPSTIFVPATAGLLLASECVRILKI